MTTTPVQPAPAPAPLSLRLLERYASHLNKFYYDVSAGERITVILAMKLAGNALDADRLDVFRQIVTLDRCVSASEELPYIAGLITGYKPLTWMGGIELTSVGGPQRRLTWKPAARLESGTFNTPEALVAYRSQAAADTIARLNLLKRGIELFIEARKITPTSVSTSVGADALYVKWKDPTTGHPQELSYRLNETKAWRLTGSNKELTFETMTDVLAHLDMVDSAHAFREDERAERAERERERIRAEARIKFAPLAGAETAGAGAGVFGARGWNRIDYDHRWWRGEGR